MRLSRYYKKDPESDIILSTLYNYVDKDIYKKTGKHFAYTFSQVSKYYYDKKRKMGFFYRSKMRLKFFIRKYFPHCFALLKRIKAFIWKLLKKD